MKEQIENFKAELKKFGNLAVAFSGGVDSSLLAKLAYDALGKRMVAITIDTQYVARRELEEAKNFALTYGFRHEILRLNTPAAIKTNPKMRCYECKNALFNELLAYAKELGFTNFADGTNADDLHEFRPGLRALSELGVVSPLKKFSKKQIREMSKFLSLSTHEKPSYACLLTRFPENFAFSQSDLSVVECAESLLISYGYANVRARFDGKVMRIELTHADMVRFVADVKFKAIVRELAKFGEYEIVLDLKGLRGEILL